MLDYLVSVLLGDPSVPPSYRSMRTTMLVAYATLVAAIFAEVSETYLYGCKQNAMA